MSSLIFIIIFVVFIIYICRLIKLKKNAVPLPGGVVHMYSGTVGSGKTSTAILADLIPHYNKLCFQYKLSKIPIIGKILPLENKKPVVYSNIPVNVSGNPKKPVMSNVLKRDHLLLREVFPSDIVPLVLIDETGIVANQYSFDDANICGKNILDDYYTLENFVRFFRHLYGGKHDNARLILTDQSVADLNVSLRRRISYIYWLYDRYHPFFTPKRLYKISVRQLILAEDGVQNANPLVMTKDEAKNEPYYLVKYPKKKYKYYDSHAYRQLYIDGKPITSITDDLWPSSTLATSYILDVSSTRKERLKRKAKQRLDDYAVKQYVDEFIKRQ